MTTDTSTASWTSSILNDFTISSLTQSYVTGTGPTEQNDVTITQRHGPTTAVAAPPPGALLFSWQDYLVFSISLAIPLAIGFFFLIYNWKARTTENFLMGDRAVNFLAVALSIVGSLLNGVFVIGIPAEIHYYGIRYMYGWFGILLAVFVVSHVFIPKYKTMMFTSCYEYVQKRYNTPTRLIASLIFALSVIIHISVVIYVPALAFQQVTNLNLYITVAFIGVICIIYTAIGGLKAVVYTDSVQMIILLIGLITVSAVGCSQLGGSGAVWQIALKDGRMNFIDFIFDPRDRTSFWPMCLGTSATYIGLFISNQMIIQRYMAVHGKVKSESILYVTILVSLPLFMLISVVGIVMHATFASCDPLSPYAPAQIKIAQANQIVPVFVMHVLGSYKGVPGMIIASIFAAAMSNVSAVINSLAAVFLEDFIDPFVLFVQKKKLTDFARRNIAIGTVIFMGLLAIALSYMSDKFTNQLAQVTNTVWGVIGGPLAGIFIMGFFFPFCNSWGAISGMIAGLGIALWLSIGAVMWAPTPTTLPIAVCIANITKAVVGATLTPDTNHLVQDWYNISFGWYGVIGTGVCIIVGIIVSLLTCGASQAYRESIPGYLMYSVADNCFCYCPLACKRCYRCGVNFDDEVPIIDSSMKVVSPESEMEDSNSYSRSNLSSNKFGFSRMNSVTSIDSRSTMDPSLVKITPINESM